MCQSTKTIHICGHPTFWVDRCRSARHNNIQPTHCPYYRQDVVRKNKLCGGCGERERRWSCVLRSGQERRRDGGEERRGGEMREEEEKDRKWESEVVLTAHYDDWFTNLDFRSRIVYQYKTFCFPNPENTIYSVHPIRIIFRLWCRILPPFDFRYNHHTQIPWNTMNTMKLH